MKRLSLALALMTLVAAPAAAQSRQTVVEGLVFHEPLLVRSSQGTIRAVDINKGLYSVLNRPGLEGQEVSVRLERGRVAAVEGVTRGTIPLLTSPGLGAEANGEIRANSTLLVLNGKRVDGRLWLRVYTNDKRKGVVSADQIELTQPGGVASWLGGKLAPFFAKGTTEKKTRFFHPDGHVYEAEVTDLKPSTFSQAAKKLAGKAMIRLGGGLQRVAEDGNENDGSDGLSMAIRFTDASNALSTTVRPGDQDIQLTAWAERFVHLGTRTPFGDPHDFFNNHYFPGMPYEIAGQPVWLRLVPKRGITRFVPKQGAVARIVGSKLGFGNAERNGRDRIPHLEQEIDKGQARFVLQVQRGDWWRLRRPWVSLVEINLIKSRPDIDQKKLKYHWTLEGAGLKPVGFVNDMRRPAYRAAQDARDALGDKQEGLIQRVRQAGRDRD